MRQLIFGSMTLWTCLGAWAEEGMWPLNGFPTEKVQKTYQFKATPEWLDHVRLSSARLAGGCSGSFVSNNGLVMTNHHCASSCIDQLSTKKYDRIANGYYAKTIKDEARCPEIEVNQLAEITDVTAKINSATQNLSGKAFNDELKASMSVIEKECSAGAETLRCEVVTLYRGGKYHLYKYKRYQDVRLVFAPEKDIAFFGGDPDNFNFPRYNLDVTFLRVYGSDGKALQTQNYFQWAPASLKEGELSFVTGHPGRTARLMTVSELEFARDVRLPTYLMYASELRGLLTEFQKRGVEQKRISLDKLFGIENWLKAMKGNHEALLNADFFAGKREAERKLREKVKSDSKLQKEYGPAWDELQAAHRDWKNIYKPLNQIEYNNMNSELYTKAKQLVRAAVELPKENSKRFREFTEARLPQLKQDLFSEAPIYDELEISMLSFHLSKMREALSPDHELVKKILGNKSTDQLAKELVQKTDLKNLKTRRKLFDGGEKAILASKDPMIQLALLMDPDARAIRKKFEDEIDTRVKQNDEKVAKALFAVYGSDTYPDATFSLRISIGQMKGWNEAGKNIQPFTTLKGAFERHTGSEPFRLPKSWLQKKDKLNLDTHFNLVTDNDIIGGNSGSPMINKDAQIVGLIFDSNIHGLGNEFGFNPDLSRAVSVDSQAIIEALDKVYGAQRVIDDIRGSVQNR